MAKQASKKTARFKLRFIVICCLLCICAAAAALYSQEQKLNDINAEVQALTDEYTALQNEEQRLEYMIEYAQTDEFKLQYAREKLGLVLPGDVKFDITD